MLPDENTQDYRDEADTLNQVEHCVHPHGPALLDLYFRIVHPSLSIIQKHLFIGRYRNGDRSFTPCLMAGMYILALNWWSLDPRLAHLPKRVALLLCNPCCSAGESFRHLQQQQYDASTGVDNDPRTYATASAKPTGGKWAGGVAPFEYVYRFGPYDGFDFLEEDSTGV